MSVLEIPRRHRMVETAMDAYFNWREQSTAVSQAYRRWVDSHEADAESAWQEYEAAHAAEDDASLLYLRIAQRTAAAGPSDAPLMARGGGAR
ncbi:MAG: hypothetical protein JWM60_687 [Solirubrobacterales bacterium]|nr:hypothetical protein [Solirubrobacterales bacterium]